MSRLSAIALMLCGVLISSISQIILKRAAGEKYNSRIREYLNTKVIVAYALFLLATLITVFVLRYIPLSVTSALESAGYVFIPVLSLIFLKEKITLKQVANISIILVGIIIFIVF